MANSLDKHLKPGYNDKNQSFNEETSSLFQSNRDYLTELCNSMNMPMKPVLCEGGYFLMCDISDCTRLIPEKFKTSHDYEREDDPNPVAKYRLTMPDGSIPLDLAFCRWMAVEKGVTMMPNSFFYHRDSPTISDKYVRLAICKDHDSTKVTAERLREAFN